MNKEKGEKSDFQTEYLEIAFHFFFTTKMMAKKKKENTHWKLTDDVDVCNEITCKLKCEKRKQNETKQKWRKK